MNVASPLTRKGLSFRVTSEGNEFQVGQKIGVTVYRNFDVEAEDAGLPESRITGADELRQIFGFKDRVNIYTGEIINI